MEAEETAAAAAEEASGGGSVVSEFNGAESDAAASEEGRMCLGFSTADAFDLLGAESYLLTEAKVVERQRQINGSIKVGGGFVEGLTDPRVGCFDSIVGVGKLRKGCLIPEEKRCLVGLSVFRRLWEGCREGEGGRLQKTARKGCRQRRLLLVMDHRQLR